MQTATSGYGGEADVIAGKGIYFRLPFSLGSVGDGCFWREAGEGLRVIGL